MEDFLSKADPAAIAVILLFGCITFTTVAMAARTWLLGDNRAFWTAMTISSERIKTVPHLEKNYVSIFVFLYHATLFGMVLLAAYILEHHPPFPHAERAAFDADYLVFLVLLILGYSVFTFQRNDGMVTSDQTGTVSDKADMVSIKSAGSVRSSGSGRGRTIRSSHSDASWRSNRSESSRRSNRSENSSQASSVEEIDWQQQDQRSMGSNSNPVSHSSMLSTAIEEVEGEEDNDDDGEVSTFLGSIASASLITASTGTSQRSRNSQQSTDSQDRKLEEVRLDDGDTFTLPSKHASKHSKRPRDAEQRIATGDTGLLNMDQTTEWKGLLSIVFLAYKLSGADLEPRESNLFYNAVQVASSCFVFLTGFGNAMYFYSRNDYRFTRVLHVFFRINLTALWLCLTLGNRYIFYYVCPLHTLAFLLTYGTMRISRHLNYSKFGLRTKLFGLGAVIFAVWDLNFGLFQVLFLPLFASSPSVAGAPNGPLYEWYYQTHVQHWAAFAGIVYAVNYPITNLVLARMECSDLQSVILAKGVICVGLMVALGLWISGPFSTNKLTFDSTHPYFGFLPLLSYIYFRNVTRYLRERHMSLLRSVGGYALELYLLHYHFFLSDDGMSMLNLLPGYPKCNVILTGALLFLVASLVWKFTRVILAMMLPLQDEGKSVRYLIISAGCSVALYSFSLLMKTMGMVNMGSIATVIVICGSLLYQTVMDMTWQDYRGMPILRQSSTDSVSSLPDDSTVVRISPPIIGTMIVVLLGVGWRMITIVGATDTSSMLPPACEASANSGIWTPVDSCGEFQRSRLTRDFGAGFYYGDCDDSSNMQWGWLKTELTSRCRFHGRDSKSLQRRLGGRSIVFLGDVTVRNLFDALRRALGELTAGEYDAAASDHADISRVLGDVRLEYKWAPLAYDQVSKLKTFRSKGISSDTKPDVIIVGGGTLDRLHVWATDEDQESHKSAVRKLASELQALQTVAIPTIWCTPTTINTQALSNEEKRNQMNELAVEEMRKMYAQMNVEESASFVLDGPSYSRGRVADSYDGVMYPPSVYDAGIQIVANAFDWLLGDGAVVAPTPLVPPPVGTMGNPFLGLMMICFSAIGLLFFDGYFGFSYLSSLLIRKTSRTRANVRQYAGTTMPNDLYEEAFAPYHRRLKLPTIEGPSPSRGRRRRPQPIEPMEDSEILSLLENESTVSDNSGKVKRRGTRNGELDNRSASSSLPRSMG